MSSKPNLDTGRWRRRRCSCAPPCGKSEDILGDKTAGGFRWHSMSYLVGLSWRWKSLKRRTSTKILPYPMLFTVHTSHISTSYSNNEPRSLSLSQTIHPSTTKNQNQKSSSSSSSHKIKKSFWSKTLSTKTDPKLDAKNTQKPNAKTSQNKQKNHVVFLVHFQHHQR